MKLKPYSKTYNVLHFSVGGFHKSCTNVYQEFQFMKKDVHPVNKKSSWNLDAKQWDRCLRQLYEVNRLQFQFLLMSVRLRVSLHKTYFQTRLLLPNALNVPHPYHTEKSARKISSKATLFSPLSQVLHWGYCVVKLTSEWGREERSEYEHVHMFLLSKDKVTLPLPVERKAYLSQYFSLSTTMKTEPKEPTLKRVE